jgi:TatD DNase family protein
MMGEMAMHELVDTHCHIQSVGQTDVGEKHTRQLWKKAADKGVTAASVVDEARQAGVTRMVCVGCEVPDSVLAVKFVQDKPGLFASIGIHPHEAARYHDDAAALKEFAGLVTQPKVVAVGECGLDYYYGHSPKAAQTALLKFQLELAVRCGLPVIFHVREAFDDFWPIFDEYTAAGFAISGVLHSFTDSYDNFEQAMKRGLYIGINGIATFNTQTELQRVHADVPLDRLLLETDAPFLTPHPYRGTICEPKHVRVTAEFLARLRGDRLSTLAQASTTNARQLFGME